ncbi:MAG: PQQ-binding-like beta-propeller repeat protein, partial [Anaerolineaceae bacterium]|nr:PQQ-binding-like beta-propeller repeat protein [Anaerolineaceae bacterium]
LYVGMGHGDFVNTAEQVAANLGAKLKEEGKSKEEIAGEVGKIRPVGEVWCIDLASSKVDWKFPVGRVVLGAVAVDGDQVYFGSRDEHLYRVSTDGKSSRKWNAQASIVTSPAVAKKHVYVMTESGQLYGLDKKKMSLVWNVSLNTPSFSSPTVARGHVYVGSTGNGLLCVGRPGRGNVKPIWPGALGGAGKAGWLDDSMLPARGAYSWGYVGQTGQADDSGRKPAPPEIYAPAAYVDGAFYVGLNRPGTFGLARLDAEQKAGEKQSGDEKPRNKAGGKLAQRWLARSKNAVYLSAAATGDAVFFVDGRPGDSGRMLRRLDAETGRELWTRPVASAAGGELVITYDKLFIADTAAGLTCLDVAGPAAAKELWRAEVGPTVGPPVVTADMIIVAVRSPAQLVMLDRATGVPLLAVPLKLVPRTGPLLMGNRVWFGTAGGVGCYDLSRSRMAEMIDTGAVATPLVATTDRLACVNEAGELVVITLEPMEEVFDSQKTPRGKIDALLAGYAAAGWPASTETRDGKLVIVRPQWPTVQRVAGALTSLPPVLTDEAVLFAARGSLRYWDLESHKNSQWARIRASFPGRLTSPMIVADSHVFFATDKKGLVCMKPKRK